MDDLSLEGLLRVEEAIAIIDSTPVEPIVAIDVDLSRLEEQLTANVLASDVLADRDYPPFDKSMLDGFAVRVADLPGTLDVIGEIAAGSTANPSVAAGQTFAIMTGAPFPAGADAVVPVEHTHLSHCGKHVRIDKAVAAGKGIAPRGSDARAGDPVLARGTPIGPAQLAALAAVGAMRVRVSGDPISHVLVTGDEILDPADDATPTGSQIRDSNGPALVSLLKHLSTLPGLSHVTDNRGSILAAIDMISAEADVLLVSGGMSMGRHDHVPGVLKELGFELLITKLRIKPGKPFVFAVRKRAEKTDYVFGLPGNPVSSFVCTMRFASRLIQKLRSLVPRDGFIPVRLGADLPPNGGREFYQPATLDGDGTAMPLGWKGSADVFTLARADCLIVRTIDEPARRAGEIVRAMLIPR